MSPSRPALGFAYTPVNLTDRYTLPDVSADATATQYRYNFDRRLTWSGPVAGSVAVACCNNVQVTQQTVNSTNGIAFAYDRDGLRTASAVTRNAQDGLLTGSRPA